MRNDYHVMPTFLRVPFNYSVQVAATYDPAMAVRAPQSSHSTVELEE